VQTSAVALVQRFPDALFDLLVFATMGAVGQLVIFYNIREFGSVASTTITVTRSVQLCHCVSVVSCVWSDRELGTWWLLSMEFLLNGTPCLLLCRALSVHRKFLTIVLSVVRFGHPMSSLQWSGVTFVFGGLIMEAIHKYQMQKQRQDKTKKL
jgi:hypothetical protein